MINLPDKDALYALLPEVYRERDDAEGHQLRALLRLISDQAEIVRGDIEQLWDNYFIETCEPWVVAYIADLVGNELLHDAGDVDAAQTANGLFRDLAGSPNLRYPLAVKLRADVAKTIYYRRRKGTLPMLEELARDVTGWSAHAVEFFQGLGWTQYVRNHLRPHSTHGAEIRYPEVADRNAGAFDSYSHTVDVRPISSLDGWHNIKNIGFFLWRLSAYEARGIDARRFQYDDDYRYHFSPLGNDAPLFSRWRREGDEAGLATEFHVPGPIRPTLFNEDWRNHLKLDPDAPYTEFYGLFEQLDGSDLPQAPSSSLMVVLHKNGIPDAVPPKRVCCMNLSAWTQPKGDHIGIDVRLGRFTLGPDLMLSPPDRVEVFFHQGFSADMGGGAYPRHQWLMTHAFVEDDAILKVGVDETHKTINDALNKWELLGKPDAIISILDNRTYTESLAIEFVSDSRLAIEAADGARPHLQLIEPLYIRGSNADAQLTLNGLLVEEIENLAKAAVNVEGEIGCLRILHCTLVPGSTLAQLERPISPHPLPPPWPPSIAVAAGEPDALINQNFRLEIAFSITGQLCVPVHAKGIWVLDSIIDSGKVDVAAITTPGPTTMSAPPLWLERTTIFGEVRTTEVTLASEVIFNEPVISERQQVGCIRFSFVPEGSDTPKRYRCQPDLKIASEINSLDEAGKSVTDYERNAIRERVTQWLVPGYTSTDYGQPGYTQLNLTCPVEIKTGAEDGSEMGAFCHLKQPQRETNLKLRLREYLPVGLKPGLIYVT